ncbi:MAG: hypothetical protein B7733_02685 [Myxococcales bacterium FL481]|nr:MAG: hypothetical protein B7733_02685 [Myxococcales bacterium FL481]
MRAESSQPGTAEGFTLNYASLVAEYRSGLVDKLRGFGTADGYLDVWVPDDDPTKSLQNMVEAVGLAGGRAFRVELDTATATAVRRDALRAGLGEQCKVSFVDRDDGCVVAFDSIDADRATPGRGLETSGDPPPTPRPQPSIGQLAPAPFTTAYDAALRAVAGRGHRAISRRPQSPTERVVEASHAALSLTLYVDAATHRVTTAYFAADAPVVAGALKLTCDLAIGRSIQELADHGVLHAAAALEPIASAPVPGIVHPARLCRAFARVESMLRDIRQIYAERYDRRDTANNEDLGPGPTWKRMPLAKRRAVVERELARFSSQRNLTESTMGWAELVDDVRLTLTIDDSVPAADKPALLMAAETWLRRSIDTRLEVYLAERRDKNKLRRLAVIPNDPTEETSRP